MSPSLGVYQARVDNAVASGDLGRLIYIRRQLIDQKREHYDDVPLRNDLYQLISKLNEAIGKLNLETVDRVLNAAIAELVEANDIIIHSDISCHPSYLARRVADIAHKVYKKLTWLEHDRHFSQHLTDRKAEIDRLKTDIESFSQTTLIAAAIEEHQKRRRQEQHQRLQQHLAEEEERRQKLAAAAIKLEEERRQELLKKVAELRPCFSRFESAISCAALDQARHALWVIEQAPIVVQTLMFNGQDVSMKLAHMHQQCVSLRREVYGRHGIRNLEVPANAAAAS